MKQRRRVPIEGETMIWKSPFAPLKAITLPAADPSNSINHAVPADQSPTAHSDRQPESRGRVDIIRQTAHRGGKTVTVMTGFVGVSLAEKEQLAKRMQKACGTGGTVKEGRIEIQGDRRAEVARILSEAGFRPVFAGG
jgi:translation initiation factor 1